MIRMKTLLVVWFTCVVADVVEEREFIPSASMDTEDGWRVMENPIVAPDLLSGSDPQLYLSFPKLDRLSNDIEKDFLSNDEEFRINVADIKDGKEKGALQNADSLPVASSLVASAPGKNKKGSLESALRMQKPPQFFKEKALPKPTQIHYNDAYAPYQPKKLVREPLMDRFPYYDALPENTYHSLPHFEDSIYLPSYEYQTASKHVLPYFPIETMDNSIKYYEIDKNARPIILKEEISYEGMPPFVPLRYPSMPQKMMFPGGSMFPKLYFKGPPLPISVKTRKIINKPKSMVTFSRPSRGIPIVRGRFRV